MAIIDNTQDVHHYTYHYMRATFLKIVDAKVGRSSKTGSEWVSRQILVKEADRDLRFGAQVVMEVFGDREWQKFGLEEGKEYIFTYDVDSREYNGRWYTSIRCTEAYPAAAYDYNLKEAEKLKQ